MTVTTKSQIFYNELQKLIPELRKIRNVTRVIVDAKVEEYPLLSVEIHALMGEQEGEPITRVFRIVPLKDELLDGFPYA